MTVPVCFALAAALFVCDQLIKKWAVAALAPVGSIPFIDGLLQFTYVENRGAAFGILHGQRLLLVSVTLVVLGVIGYLIASKRLPRVIERISAVLILAGGAGNLLDRALRGFVVDYIDINALFRFPMFNFADCCVSVGALLMVLAVVTQKEPDPKPAGLAGDDHAD